MKIGTLYVLAYGSEATMLHNRPLSKHLPNDDHMLIVGWTRGLLNQKKKLLK